MPLSKIEWFKVILVFFPKLVLSSPKIVVNIFSRIITPWVMCPSISSDPSHKLGQLDMVTFCEFCIWMQKSLKPLTMMFVVKSSSKAVWGLTVEQCKAEVGGFGWWWCWWCWWWFVTMVLGILSLYILSKVGMLGFGSRQTVFGPICFRICSYI